MSRYDSGIPSRIRSRAMTRKTPTPRATDQMITLFSIAGTWPARTCRSGSATVMMTPMRKLMPTMTHTFLERVISLPTASPRGIMDISDPRENRPMPTISSRLPIRNAIIALLDTGVTVKHSSSTMAVMGSTEVSDSRMGLRKIARTCPFSRRFRRRRACWVNRSGFLRDNKQFLLQNSGNQNDSVPVRLGGQIRKLYH